MTSRRSSTDLETGRIVRAKIAEYARAKDIEMTNICDIHLDGNRGSAILESTDDKWYTLMIEHEEEKTMISMVPEWEDVMRVIDPLTSETLSHQQMVYDSADVEYDHIIEWTQENTVHRMVL